MTHPLPTPGHALPDPGDQSPREYAYPAALVPPLPGAIRWQAEVPDLPECGSEGDTLEEVIANVVDAVQAWITHALSRGEELPQAGSLDRLARQPEYARALWVLIVRKDKPSDLEVSKALAEAEVLPSAAELPLPATCVEPILPP